MLVMPDGTAEEFTAPAMLFADVPVCPRRIVTAVEPDDEESEPLLLPQLTFVMNNARIINKIVFFMFSFFSCNAAILYQNCKSIETGLGVVSGPPFLFSESSVLN